MNFQKYSLLLDQLDIPHKHDEEKIVAPYVVDGRRLLPLVRSVLGDLALEFELSGLSPSQSVIESQPLDAFQ